MKLTDIFKFKLFERTDPVDMETVNENFESVEKLFKGLDQVDNTSDCDKNVASAKEHFRNIFKENGSRQQ